MSLTECEIPESIDPYEVGSYRVYFYGSPTGYDNKSRAQIELKSPEGNVIAWIRFSDPGQVFEEDQEWPIEMHLPSSMFANVMDVLRNEKPIYIYFKLEKAFLATCHEPIGSSD